MHVISINIGKARAIEGAKDSGVTGIYKQPVETTVRVTANGLEGDTICDTENHGGADQAVYVYGTPDYAWWSEHLGNQLAPGTFGENLTISDLESASANVGDLLHIGEVTLQVTAPRIPCVTLARRMNDPAFLKRFRAAERPGLYCRVLREGYVQAGDPVVLERYEGAPLSAIEMFRYFFAPDESADTLRRHLAAPVAIRDRVEKEQRLRELLAKRDGAGRS